MKGLEKLIRDMRKQLFPYHHEHDIERGRERWEIGEAEYIESWLLDQLRACHAKNRCEKDGRCVFYEYGDLAKRNYEICTEMQLRIENGSIKCSINEGDGKEL